LEVWRERRVEDKERRESREEERGGEGNDYRFPLFGCFKI
jgi:hypothetical protein